jgi:hypothetical protein
MHSGVAPPSPDSGTAAVRHTGERRNRAEEIPLTRSVTFRLPSPRTLALAAVTLLAGLLVLWAGIRVGSGLVTGSPLERLARTPGVHELVTPSGTFLGRIVEVDEAFVRLAEPAFVRGAPAAQASASPGPQALVQPMTAFPYLLSGDLVIAADDITAAGLVTPGSELESVYRNAVAGAGNPAPSAAP